MIRSKVIDALASLNKKELKEFEDFIISPFYNKNKSIHNLFYALKSFYPKFESKKLTKQLLFNKVYPNREFSDKALRNLLSDLLILVEKYLSVNSFNQNELLKNYYNVLGLLNKGLYSLTETGLKKTDKISKIQKFDGGNNYYTMHLVEMIKDFLSISKNRLIDLNMKEGEYLIYSFLCKFLIFKMKYFNYRIKSGTERMSPIIEEFEKIINIGKFVQYLENTTSPESDMILMYYYCTKFLSNLNQDEYYRKVKLMLKENKNQMIRTEVINLYLNFNAYCIAKIRSGDVAYEQELFEIYREMLEEKLLLDKGDKYLHITIFNNIVSLGLSIGELFWTQSFIEKYSEELIPEYRSTIYNYSYAQYYFAMKEFDKALNCINKVNFDNHYIKNGVRILLLKIYYELKYTEPFFSLLDSFKHYLAKDKLLPKDKKEGDNKFSHLINRLYKYALEPTTEKLDSIKADIPYSFTGMHKEWLLEKLKELEN